VTADAELVLGVLNSTPVVDGVATDNLEDLRVAQAWLVSMGGLGTEAELSDLLRARTALQRIVRGESSVATLGPLLRGVALVPEVEGEIRWTLSVDPDRELAVRAVLAWDTIVKQSPGRLRPCANDECRLFLIDRTTAGRARWCSMAVCGNRIKARRHYQRRRDASGGTGP
jgi:predicted RNA-binding Zn ribbon-like protein